MGKKNGRMKRMQATRKWLEHRYRYPIKSLKESLLVYHITILRSEFPRACTPGDSTHETVI